MGSMGSHSHVHMYINETKSLKMFLLTSTLYQIYDAMMSTLRSWTSSTFPWGNDASQERAVMPVRYCAEDVNSKAVQSRF